MPMTDPADLTTDLRDLAKLRNFLAGAFHGTIIANFSVDDGVETLDRSIEHIIEMRIVLKYLLDHKGECLADNPKWVAKIEALLAASPASPAAPRQS